MRPLSSGWTAQPETHAGRPGAGMGRARRPGETTGPQSPAGQGKPGATSSTDPKVEVTVRPRRDRERSHRAVSRRRGNEELLEGFAWGEVAQARSGAFVELFGDGGEVGLVVGDVGALGQVLTDQTDGALVGSALPR